MDDRLDPRPGNDRQRLRGLATPGHAADWRSSIEAAPASEFLIDARGPDFHKTCAAIKRAEYLRVAGTVSDVDYELYLHEV